MINEKYLFRKNKKVNLTNMIGEVSEEYYSRIKLFASNDDNFFFIATISNISLNIYDFYIDVNRENNIFYNNINLLNNKLLKIIYKLISSYIVIKFLMSNNNDENCDIIIENNFKTFKFNHKEKKLFYKLKNIYDKDEIDFDLKFNFLFAKKVFSSKKNNAMEFAYINYFIESLYSDFKQDYNETMSRSILIS